MYTEPMEIRSRSVCAGRRKKRGRNIGWVLLILLVWSVTIYLLACSQADASSTQPTFSRSGETETEGFTEIGDDTTPPVIIGTLDHTIYEGETVSYFTGIVVTDTQDPEPELTVDSSGVDVRTPGCYFVTYIAKDRAGNTTTKAATVTVLPMEAGSVTTQQLNETADEILEQIIAPDMTTRQQVEAIYGWCREALTYKNQEHGTDWRQAAYDTITEKSGDCFGYFSVSKLLLERLEIPNLDVRKERQSKTDSDHFWSLVSVDGGETYYHFDCTPRIGQTQDFCLVTDAVLDAYSDANNGSHSRNRSLYTSKPAA